jgi:hypothetical protein
MGKLTGLLAIIATAITAQIAVAQTPQNWPCPQCRAVYEFKTCETVSEADASAHQAVIGRYALNICPLRTSGHG